jgi:TP901-1 family phage major tail protein
MAAQRGKDLLLKIESDGYSSFVTVAGLRSKRLAFNSARQSTSPTPSRRGDGAS